MSGHRRWAQKMMAKPMPLTVELEEQAADRERRRIRRAIAKAMKAVTGDHWDDECDCLTCSLIRAIDAATRAKKGKRK